MIDNNVLRLPAIFSDNMVLQRNAVVPVWGWAAPGAKVTVAIDSQSACAQADASGKWTVKFSPLQAGGPFELTVRTGDKRLTVRNVLVGEVWLCSGQSNMEWPIAQTMNAQEEIAAINYPAIRLFRVPKRTSAQPEADVEANWNVCTRDGVMLSAANFSAVGYFFGRDLHKRLNVPVGLIDASWGGTIVEAWTSMDALRTQPEMLDLLKRYEEMRKDLPAARAEYAAKLKQWEKDSYWDDPGNKGEGMGWAKPDFDDSDWGAMNTPGCWEATGMNIDGSVWFRKEIQLDEHWLGKDLMLNVGIVDDYDTTYVNGVKVGSIGQETVNPWGVHRQYKVGGSLLKAGRNVIAVRVFDRFGTGGLMGPVPMMNLFGGDLMLSLAGKWKYKVELALEPKPSKPMPLAPPGSDDANVPAALYNGMIHPLIPFAVAGAIWYQGESNAVAAFRYRRYFPLMIDDWRRWWDCDLAFLFVELANFQSPQTHPVEPHTWPELREAQQMTLSLPKTGMATAIDIGDTADIHPRNKQEVGRRLALSALAVQYGKKLVHSGPLYKSMNVEDGAIRISFNHAGSGLRVKGKLKGFAVAGENRQWVWADARIDGKTVVCSSPDVPCPVAVRYSWADDPIGNLYNKEGLPASPFRTDNWPGVTDKN